MILEVADIEILPGHQAEFDEAIIHGLSTVTARAKGFIGYRVLKGIESPTRYLLEVEWQTIENHTVDFRQSEAFAVWRGIVGKFFARPPIVEHFDMLP